MEQRTAPNAHITRRFENIMRGDPYLPLTKNQWTEYTLFTRACLQEWGTMSDYQHISTQVRPVLQETQIRSPIQEDSTCHGATTIIELSRAHMPQLQKPMHLVPMLCNEKNCHDETSNVLQLEKSPHSSEDPAWPLPRKKKKKNREWPSLYIIHFAWIKLQIIPHGYCLLWSTYVCYLLSLGNFCLVFSPVL